MSYTFRRMADT